MKNPCASLCPLCGKTLLVSHRELCPERSEPPKAGTSGLRKAGAEDAGRARGPLLFGGECGRIGGVRRELWVNFIESGR